MARKAALDATSWSRTEVYEPKRDSNARTRIHKIVQKGIRQLTVRTLATYGDPSARIFKVQVY